MPDDDLDLEDEYEDEETPDPPRQRNPVREQLRRAQKELKERRAKDADAEKAIRDAAFLRAGIDLDDPKQSYFVKGYDGDPDPETIRAAAVEAGFVEPPDPPPDAAAHAAIGAVSATGRQAPPDDGQPRFIQDPDGYAQARAQARDQSELLSVMDAWGSPTGSRTIGD